MSTSSAPSATPSVARMFEYWLGGSHFLPLDEQFAKAFEQVFPPAQPAYRTLRRCTQVAVARMHGWGIRRYLVLGAGIPASGNVHEFAPGSEVLYSDIDPAAVELGTQLTEALPGVAYTWADAGRPLESKDVAGFVAESSAPLGVLYTGVTPFIDDESLGEAVRALHEVAPSGSVLFLDFDGPGFAEFPAAVDAIRRNAPQYAWRTRAACEQLFGPWALGPTGVVDAATWTGATDGRAGGDTPLTYVGFARRSD